MSDEDIIDQLEEEEYDSGNDSSDEEESNSPPERSDQHCIGSMSRFVEFCINIDGFTDNQGIIRYQKMINIIQKKNDRTQKDKIIAAHKDVIVKFFISRTKNILDEDLSFLSKEDIKLFIGKSGETYIPISAIYKKCQALNEENGVDDSDDEDESEDYVSGFVGHLYSVLYQCIDNDDDREKIWSILQNFEYVTPDMTIDMAVGNIIDTAMESIKGNDLQNASIGDLIPSVQNILSQSGVQDSMSGIASSLRSKDGKLDMSKMGDLMGSLIKRVPDNVSKNDSQNKKQVPKGKGKGGKR